jgi:FlaA1/EpsC-like NDP-sugar epimerase
MAMLARSGITRIEGLRTTGQAAVDSLAWTAGLVFALWSRYDFVLTMPRLRAVLVVAVAAVVLQNAIGHRLFLYRGRYAYGSFEEVLAVSCTSAAAIALLFIGNLLLPHRQVPASTPLGGGVYALIAMLAIRYVRRLQREQQMRPDVATATPVLLLGAGDAGSRLVRAMSRDPASKYLPVGILDDDPGKRNLRISRVPILGGLADLPAAVSRTQARAVVFAIPSGDASLVRQSRELAESAGVAFKILPPLSELLDHRVEVSDIRDLDVRDLLGRRQIETDLNEIAGYLTGRRVLVTGAGGSIGSELCRQIHRYAPSELIMLDRDESALHAVQLSLYGKALLDDPDVVLADLRDEPRIREIFAGRRPEVVFHAAALKHQPLLEQYPAEAVKSNIWGTIAVLEAAADFGVEEFVNISTDKAANPCNVLGYSKRVTERLTAGVAARAAGRFVSVRFGNVLGSRGSVLNAFAAQIASGGPVTVTDRRVTRFFMTVPEAVELVIQAAAVGRPGEALVLDMGEPVRIDEVARQMVSMAASPVEIVYTGLRPAEKLHESLFGAGERDERPRHPLISHVVVPQLSPLGARAIDVGADRDAIIDQLVDLCGEGAVRPDARLRLVSSGVADR